MIIESRSKNNIKLTILFGAFCFVTFLLVIIYYNLFQDDKTLNFENSIDLNVTKIREYKGFVTMNDSIAIDGNLLRVNFDSTSMRYKNFDLLKPNFRITKEAKNDTIIVLKDSEILIYKLEANQNSRWSW